MTDDSHNAHKLMDRLIRDRKYSIARWVDARFGKLRAATATDKGNLGEDFLVEMLRAAGYGNVRLSESRKGPWDVQATNGNKDVKFEVKVATQDVNGAHQFSGIRCDTAYTHLFFLGVLPEELRYMIIDKRNLGDYTMTPMAKGTNAAFKITRRSAALKPFASFGDELKSLLGEPK